MTIGWRIEAWSGKWAGARETSSLLRTRNRCQLTIMTLGEWSNMERNCSQQLHLNMVLSGPPLPPKEICQKSSNLWHCKPSFIIRRWGLERSIAQSPLPHELEWRANWGWEAKINILQRLPQPWEEAGDITTRRCKRTTSKDHLFHTKGTSLPVWAQMSTWGATYLGAKTIRWVSPAGGRSLVANRLFHW